MPKAVRREWREIMLTRDCRSPIKDHKDHRRSQPLTFMFTQNVTFPWVTIQKSTSKYLADSIANADGSPMQFWKSGWSDSFVWKVCQAISGAPLVTKTKQKLSVVMLPLQVLHICNFKTQVSAKIQKISSIDVSRDWNEKLFVQKLSAKIIQAKLRKSAAQASHEVEARNYSANCCAAAALERLKQLRYQPSIG